MASSSSRLICGALLCLLLVSIGLPTYFFMMLYWVFIARTCLNPSSRV